MVKKQTIKVLCELCEAEIPNERLEILPYTTTCVKCSQTQPYSGDIICGLNIEDIPDGINMEDFEDDGGSDYSSLARDS